MFVISRKMLREFWAKHAECETALKAWFSTAQRIDFRDLNHVKATFGPKHVDLVRPWTIINVGSNKCRLIVIMKYRQRRVFIRHVFTHQEYDRWNDHRRDDERREYERISGAYEAMRRKAGGPGRERKEKRS